MFRGWGFAVTVNYPPILLRHPPTYHEQRPELKMTGTPTWIGRSLTGESIPTSHLPLPLERDMRNTAWDRLPRAVQVRTRGGGETQSPDSTGCGCEPTSTGTVRPKTIQNRQGANIGHQWNATNRGFFDAPQHHQNRSCILELSQLSCFRYQGEARSL